MERMTAKLSTINAWKLITSKCPSVSSYHRDSAPQPQAPLGQLVTISVIFFLFKILKIFFKILAHF